MALLTTSAVSPPSGNAPVLAAANAGGDTVEPGDTTYLHVHNASGASINVTIPRYPATDQDGVATPALVVAVGAGAGKVIGPLRKGRYANPATGLVEVAYSSATSVTVAATARNG